MLLEEVQGELEEVQGELELEVRQVALEVLVKWAEVVELVGQSATLMRLEASGPDQRQQLLWKMFGLLVERQPESQVLLLVQRPPLLLWKLPVQEAPL